MLASFDSYRIFYYVAKYGSISQAANMLPASQPNVSRAVQNLEAALGCKLFFRSNRGVTLTPEGEKLYAHAAAACEQIQAGEEALARDRSLERGRVSIGVSEIALHSVLLGALERFHRAYPGIRIRISNHSTPQAVAALSAGAVDLALVTSPTGVAKPLEETRLRAFQEILIGGPRFFALAEEPAGLSDILDKPLIGLGRDSCTYGFYRQLFLHRELSYEPDMEAATADQILPMVKSNLGLGFIPAFFAGEALSRGEVRQIPLEEEIPLRHVCLVRDKKRLLSIAARALAESLLEEGNLDFSGSE